VPLASRVGQDDGLVPHLGDEVVPIHVGADIQVVTEAAASMWFP
jgi:hypothetical protein